MLRGDELGGIERTTGNDDALKNEKPISETLTIPCAPDDVDLSTLDSTTNVRRCKYQEVNQYSNDNRQHSLANSDSRVRRTELRSPSPSPPSSPDATFTDLLRSKFQQQFATSENDYDSPPASELEISKVEDAALPFHLFRPSTSTAPSRMLLHSPPPAQRSPGFLTPNRPLPYYIAGPTSPSRRRELHSVAVSGETVTARSYGHTSWPGCALPWRVRNVTVSVVAVQPQNVDAPVRIEGTDAAEGLQVRKRKRAGKKRRIAMRVRVSAQRGKEQEAAVRIEEEQEKRTRRNREKKVKRKAKEKAKKDAGGVGDGDRT